jgi:MFS family permease
MSEPETQTVKENTVPEKASPYAWYALGVLTVVYMLNFIDRQILSILSNDIKRDLGLNDADLGFLYGTAFGVFYATFGIPLGKLADSWNRTKLLTLGLTLWSSMTALSGFARNGMELTAARIGVGVGEATASPSAYSLLSDWFPKGQRARALSIYSSGLYIGGGVSLWIGSQAVYLWENMYPGRSGPMGLAGWQAAMLAVGLPGLLVALWVFSLKEPVRGASEGRIVPPVKRPWKGFFDELFNVIPPLTFIGAARRGTSALVINILAALFISAIAYVMFRVTGGSMTSARQWGAMGLGSYAVFSWAASLRASDPPAFALIWKSPAFISTVIGYGMIAFSAYAVSYWSAPYAERALEVTKFDAAIWIGAPGALAGFLGVILGGMMADRIIKRNPAGRIIVIMFGAIAPVIPFIIMFTTKSANVFYIAHFVAGICASAALGAAAATSQDLVLPRMRGVATATFFIGTTLIGLSLGPYLAGFISATNGEDLGFGMLCLLAFLPIPIIALIIAYRTVPEAERTVIERAKAAGEPS